MSLYVMCVCMCVCMIMWAWRNHKRINTRLSTQNKGMGVSGHRVSTEEEKDEAKLKRREKTALKGVIW